MMGREYVLDDIIEMRKSGVAWKQIAKHYGVAPKSFMRDVRMMDFPEELIGRQRRSTADEIRVMVKEWGWNDRQIADHYGISKDAAERRRRRAGILIGDSVPRRRRTAEELAYAESLLDEGYSFRAVSGMTGMDHNTLSRHFPGRAFTREQSVEASSLAKRMYWIERKIEGAA